MNEKKNILKLCLLYLCHLGHPRYFCHFYGEIILKINLLQISKFVKFSGQNHDTEQVSLEEFLESCRATSLLAELEDDEELPEAEDEDNDDDANDDEEDYDENFDEESATSEPRNTVSTLTSR